MFSDPERRRCNALNEPVYHVPFTGPKEDSSARTSRPILPWAVTLPHTVSLKVVIALDLTMRVTYADERLQEAFNPPRRDAAFSDSARR